MKSGPPYSSAVSAPQQPASHRLHSLLPISPAGPLPLLGSRLVFAAARKATEESEKLNERMSPTHRAFVHTHTHPPCSDIATVSVAGNEKQHLKQETWLTNSRARGKISGCDSLPVSARWYSGLKTVPASFFFVILWAFQCKNGGWQKASVHVAAVSVEELNSSSVSSTLFHGLLKSVLWINMVPLRTQHCVQCKFTCFLPCYFDVAVHLHVLCVSIFLVKWKESSLIQGGEEVTLPLAQWIHLPN